MSPFHCMRNAWFVVPALIAASAVAPASASECNSDLTGRVLAPAEIRSFGTVQGLPQLPLKAGEYVISIDDGPLPATTPELAAILDRACVKGIFFFVGRRLDAHPELARTVEGLGDMAGSHSFTHPDFGKLEQPARMQELADGVASVEKATGSAATKGGFRYVRFPGAAGFPPKLDPNVVADAEARGWIVAGYDISPEDWRNSPPEESFARIVKRLGDRGVIVFHDGQSNTPLLLPMVLQELSRRGAKVVSLP